MIKAWIKAFRLRTLPLAIASISMGGFVAAFGFSFQASVFFLCLLTTLLLQILSNLANDYGDFKHGADSEQRVGPKRAVQSGLITPGQMKMAMIIFAALALVSGVSLLLLSLEISLGLLGFFVLGLLCIAAAIKYTAGNNPYGYSGFGDPSVFLFFGPVAVLGTYYLQSHNLPWKVILPAITSGLFATAVLNINNMRDIQSDEAAGKRSIPVRIGLKAAKVYHLSMLSIAVLCAVLFTIITYRSALQWIFLPAIFLIVRNGLSVWRTEENAALDPFLKQMAISSLIFTFLFGAGLLLSV